MLPSLGSGSRRGFASSVPSGLSEMVQSAVLLIFAVIVNVMKNINNMKLKTCEVPRYFSTIGAPPVRTTWSIEPSCALGLSGRFQPNRTRGLLRDCCGAAKDRAGGVSVTRNDVSMCQYYQRLAKTNTKGV